MAENFTPGETISLAVTSAGASTSFSLAQSAGYPDCMITNIGSVLAFVCLGSAAGLPGAGAINATPVMAGESIVLRKGSGVSQCCAITQSGGTVLYFTAGQGN